MLSAAGVPLAAQSPLAAQLLQMCRCVPVCLLQPTRNLSAQLQSAQVLAPEEVVDDLFSPTKRQETRYLWKTQRERTVWLVSVLHSMFRAFGECRLLVRDAVQAHRVADEEAGKRRLESWHANGSERAGGLCCPMFGLRHPRCCSPAQLCQPAIPDDASTLTHTIILSTPATRASSQSDLRQAATAARIAYCAAVLEQQAEPMLAALAKAGSKASGGRKGGKAGSGKAAGAGGSKAAAAAGSRPVSRANSTANLEAAAAEAKGSGKGNGRAAAASGKRRAPPLPDNMRQTRSRH